MTMSLRIWRHSLSLALWVLKLEERGPAERTRSAHETGSFWVGLREDRALQFCCSFLRATSARSPGGARPRQKAHDFQRETRGWPKTELVQVVHTQALQACNVEVWCITLREGNKLANCTRPPANALTFLSPTQPAASAYLSRKR